MLSTDMPTTGDPITRADSDSEDEDEARRQRALRGDARVMAVPTCEHCGEVDATRFGRWRAGMYGSKRLCDTCGERWRAPVPEDQHELRVAPLKECGSRIGLQAVPADRCGRHEEQQCAGQMDRTTTLRTAASAKPAISAARFAHMVEDGVGAAKNDAAKASASFANTHTATAQTADQNGPPPTLYCSTDTPPDGGNTKRGRPNGSRDCTAKKPRKCAMEAAHEVHWQRQTSHHTMVVSSCGNMLATMTLASVSMCKCC